MAISTIALIDSDKTEVTKVIEDIYKERCSMFTTSGLANLPNYFDNSQKLGKWSCTLISKEYSPR